jgi:hypothetical protein
LSGVLARTPGLARIVAGGALLTAALATPLAAQFKSLPVYGDAGTGGLWAVWLDAGSGVNGASGRAQQYGARLSGAVGPLTLGVGGGLWETGSGASPAVDGSVGLRLLGGSTGSLALGLLAGVGYARSGPDSAASSYVTVPLALVLTFQRVRAAGRDIVPWLAPRAELDRVRFPGVQGDQGGVGMSAGLNAPVSGRVGVHGALDWLALVARRQGGVTFVGGSRLTAGLGVHVLLAAPAGGRVAAR